MNHLELRVSSSCSLRPCSISCQPPPSALRHLAEIERNSAQCNKSACAIQFDDPTQFLPKVHTKHAILKKKKKHAMGTYCHQQSCQSERGTMYFCFHATWSAHCTQRWTREMQQKMFFCQSRSRQPCELHLGRKSPGRKKCRQQQDQKWALRTVVAKIFRCRVFFCLQAMSSNAEGTKEGVHGHSCELDDLPRAHLLASISHVSGRLVVWVPNQRHSKAQLAEEVTVK